MPPPRPSVPSFPSLHPSFRRIARRLSAAALAALALGAAHAEERAPIRLALVEGLSGPFGNTGEAVYRNLVWAVERVNAHGGVRWADGAHALRVDRYDSRGQVDEALSAMRAAIDDGARVILQGNSSAIASALVAAIEKQNERDPAHGVVFLNYAAVDPALTNADCSFWHFRFDAHADMRLAALMQVVDADRALKRVYLIGQDYSFGQALVRDARARLAAERPDVAIVGEDLHPLGRVKDFSPYAAKIVASGAGAVITGNWGNDLTLLVRAAHDAGFRGRFYTFYGNALGAPAAIRDAGIGQVVAVADWLPNVETTASADFYRAFRARFPGPADDYVHMRMQLMVEALADALTRAGTDDAAPLARALESADVTLAGRHGHMRAADHQFQQPLVVGVMDRRGTPGVAFDVEGSGYGFRVIRDLAPAEAEQPTTCRMRRPAT